MINSRSQAQSTWVEWGRCTGRRERRGKGLGPKGWLRVRRKHKHKCKDKHNIVYTCDKHKHMVIAIALVYVPVLVYTGDATT